MIILLKLPSLSYDFNPIYFILFLLLALWLFNELYLSVGSSSMGEPCFGTNEGPLDLTIS